MAAIPLTSKISQASAGGVKFRTIKSQFGDGFGQRTPDGLNSRVEMWNLTWENITSSDKATLIAVFDAAGSSEYMTWTTPDGLAGKWIIGENGYTKNTKGGSVWTVSVSLEQVFDL